jgi:hypothetical protein
MAVSGLLRGFGGRFYDDVAAGHCPDFRHEIGMGLLQGAQGTFHVGLYQAAREASPWRCHKN